MAAQLLKLFVAGETPRAQRAIAELRALCDQELGDLAEMSIIDVVAHPELAEAEQVLVTPTVVNQAAPTIQRVIGDLSDRQRVMVALGFEVSSALADSV